MSKREDEAFAAWMQEVVAEFPAEQREAAAKVLDAPVSRERFYRGTLRSNEFYRRLNELEAAKQELESAKQEIYSWYEEEAPKQEALLEEREMLKAQLAELGAGGAPPQAGLPGFTTEDLAALKAKADKIEQLDKIIPSVLADMGAVTYDAIKNGFDIDPREVMRVSLQHGVEPYKAYEHLTTAQRQKRYEEQFEAERKKWVEEGRRQAITAKNGSPDHIQPSGPTVIDHLTRKDPVESTQQSRVSAALQAFLEGEAGQ